MIVFDGNTRHILVNSRTPLIIMKFRIFTAIRFSFTRRPHAIIVSMGLFTTISINGNSTTLIVPSMAYIRLQGQYPVPSTSHDLTQLFPHPGRAHPANRLPLRSSILLIMIMTLTFTNHIDNFSRIVTLIMIMDHRHLFNIPDLVRNLDQTGLLMVSDGGV